MPCTAEAVHQFQQARICYAPGKASNAGGVAMSGLEMSQNSTRLHRSEEDLRQALVMLSGADHLYVIGQRRAFPIAAYIAYGLSRLEFRCTFLDFVGGMVPQQVATMRSGDLLVAVAFAEYTPAVVDVVQDAHLRGIPVLAITDVATSPLARYSRLSFLVDEMDTHQFRPIAGAICLVQSLIIALGAAKDGEEGNTLSSRRFDN